MSTQARSGVRGWLKDALIPKLRSAEYDDFRTWFRDVNAERTRLVGLVLVPFAVVAALAAYLGYLPGDYRAYSAFLVGTAIGVSFISIGAHSAVGTRRSNPALSAAGEAFVLGTAVVWMLVAVRGRLDVGYGLAEFVVGTLGLAMLRGMRPRTSYIVYPALALAYTLLLVQSDYFDFAAATNAVVFSAFALIWSVATYHARISVFRNTQLLAELNRQNAQLASIAVQDPLTGLPNRRYFDQALEHRWSDEDRREAPVILILLDIDFFKQYNDRYGHPKGDACLQQVGRILATGLGTAGLCIRIGGEEFATILNTGTLEGGLATAERLVEHVRAGSDVTISAGVAALTPEEGTPDELYATADRGLYLAKHRGRDRVEAAR